MSKKDELKKKVEHAIDDFQELLANATNVPVSFRSSLTSAERALLTTFYMYVLSKSSEEQPPEL
jgi:hypothetical protein